MTSLPPNPRKRGDNKEFDSLHSPRRAGGRGRAFFLGTSLTLALTGLGVAQTKQKAKPALAKSVRLTGPQLFAAQCAPGCLPSGHTINRIRCEAGYPAQVARFLGRT